MDAARHGVVLGLAGFLGDGQSPAFLDALDADSPVAVRPGEHDRRRARAVGVGQRTEKQVHHHPPAALGFQGGEPQVAVGHRHLPGGRNDVDVVGLETLAVPHGLDRQGGHVLQQRGQRALVLRGEVEDDHVGRARLERQGREKRLERLDAPGGSAQRDHGQLLVAVGGHDVVHRVAVGFLDVIRPDGG